MTQNFNDMKAKKKEMKLLIVGHARHGKDTVARMIQEFTGLKFKGSSEAASEIFLFDVLKDKYGYKTPEECFEDRVNHRGEWFDLITEYNADDPGRLAKEILKTSDIYVGMRSRREVQSTSRFFDAIICVYDPRQPLEDKSSLDFDPLVWADIVIMNTGHLGTLESRAKLLCQGITH